MKPECYNTLAFCERYAPVAQLDRVTDYESVGRGFESLLAYHRMRLPGAVRFPVFVCPVELPTTPPKILRLGSNFWEGTDSVEHATGMFFVNPLLAYLRGTKVSCGRH